MRSFDPKYDTEERDRLQPEQWQMDLLDLNPEYVHWGPHEDYMCTRDQGWASPMMIKSWAEHDTNLDELNEVVNFYFSISRDHVECGCDHGRSEESKPFRNIPLFYHPTDDELVALAREGRVFGAKEGDSIDKLRQLAGRCDSYGSMGRGMMIDSISDYVLVKFRCDRAGVRTTCSKCGGHGYTYSPESTAKVVLTYWLIHPRKGASRGVEVDNIQKADLPDVFKFLSTAADRNAKRFAKVVRTVR